MPLSRMALVCPAVYRRPEAARGRRRRRVTISYIRAGFESARAAKGKCTRGYIWPTLRRFSQHARRVRVRDISCVPTRWHYTTFYIS